MKDFFTVTPLQTLFEYINTFPVLGKESVPLHEALGRVLAEDILSDIDIPGFSRSTMDGYAVRAASTFGASESNPAYLTLKGTIPMGRPPGLSIAAGEAARISTGGMLPEGADAVVMLEHAAEIDENTLEVYRSIAPGGHVILKGEDIRDGLRVLSAGVRIRPQEIGLLAALGRKRVPVFKKPCVGIISTGDEIVDIDKQPGPAQVRDINTHTLSGLVLETGGIPTSHGIVADHYKTMLEKCNAALHNSDMVIVSGGSSVGTRDLTTKVIKALSDSQILVHGIPISPGKPTILARVGDKPLWGLPGHVASAMVVFDRVVRPFIEHASGLGTFRKRGRPRIKAVLSRSVASAQGRTDFIRVRLAEKGDKLMAEPVLGRSGLIHTMLKADGLIEIDENTEGLEKGMLVSVIPLL